MKVIRWLIASQLLIVTAAIAGPCDGVESEALVVRGLLAQSQGKRAVELARETVDQSAECIEARLLLAEAYNARLDEVGGLRALSVSKAYRRAIKDALAIDPNHVGARTEEIGYLIHAPGIAGGDRKKASERIESLRAIDPLAAAQMQVTLARAEGDQNQLIEALAELSAIGGADPLSRSELVRRQILAGRYVAARKELARWQSEPESWVWLEHLYLQAAVKTYEETELDEAYEQLITFSQHRPHYDHVRLASTAAARALIARIEELRGNHQLALNTYQEVLKQQPDNRRAKEGVARLSTAGAGQ